MFIKIGISPAARRGPWKGRVRKRAGGECSTPTETAAIPVSATAAGSGAYFSSRQPNGPTRR